MRRWPAKADLFARVKDDGRAEAALIAVAGMMKGNRCEGAFRTMAFRCSTDERKQIEALAALRGVRVSSAIRDIIADFMGRDGGRSREVQRILNSQRSPRALKASPRRPSNLP